MKSFKYNELKAAMAICFICVLSLIVICILVHVFPDMISLLSAVIAGISIGVILSASLIVLYFRTRKELRFFVALIEHFEDLGFIRYDRKKHTAINQGNIETITGVVTKAGTLRRREYDSLLDDLYRHEHDFEDNIYSSADGRRWYRLASYESENITCTTIRDMTEYVEKTSIINNLRFYDSLTGLLNKQAFTDMLKRRVEHGYKSLGIAHFAITGIDRIMSFEGLETADDILAKLAFSVKGYDNSKSIFAGRTGSSGITVVLTQGNHEFDDYYEMIEEIYNGITGTADGLSETVRQYLKVFCGYVIYRGRETSAVRMLAASEFAAFDAQKMNSTEPVRYDSASYKESESEFKKIRIFNDIISEGLLDYHFQPIVNARTGEIYGYEALMRPHEIDDVRLTPPEMLVIAKEQNALERIESITFSMTLKVLSEHQEIFHDKRLFINSVSCVTLTETEYGELVDIYSELFPKLVVEITEVNRLSEDIMTVMNTFFKPYKTHIALDDYGAGYSNDKTLLDIMPNYIKIDRSLIEDINNDENKKQLVSNIISYASDHGVYSLAEGVETEEELETVIFLGVDLIQGYFTCRPVPIFMHEIADDIKNLIVRYSIMHAKRDDKVFEVKDDSPVDLVNLAVFGYSDIIIRHSPVNLFGKAGTTLNMRIICPDDKPVVMKLSNVNIHNDDFPVITVGGNSNFILQIEGDNTLSNQGIRIPETSKFTLKGDGNLTIDCSFVDGVCLGGNSTQSFGRIDLDGAGQINLTNKCDNCVCIGGGTGSAESVININSGSLFLNARGVDALGIGTHTGNVLIMMSTCSISVDVSGINAVAVGSVRGNANIRSSADISVTGAGNNCCLIGTGHGEHTDIQLHKGTVNINASGMSVTGIGSMDGVLEMGSSADITVTCSGDNCCMIGTHTGKNSRININDGSVKLTCNAKNIIGIGSLGGDCEISMTAGLFDILCEGSTALCIGNLKGSGNISLTGLVMNANSNSSLNQCIATNNGKITVSGGNILTNSIDPLDTYSPHGSRLVCRNIAGKADKPYELMVTDNGAVYRYIAKPSPLFDGFYVFLPEDAQ